MSEKSQKTKDQKLSNEEHWQEFWKKEKIYRFNPEASKELYTIDTPPPTVSGKIHLGHIYSYTQAEVIARFKRMEGFNVRYPFGYDNNGLPTEKLAEKEKQVDGKEMDRGKFRDICKQITKKYQKIYKDLWQTFAVSADWSLEYATNSDKVQKLSQITFNNLLKQGKIYEDKSPVLYCSTCQTAIARAEVETEEKPAVFYDLRFKKENGDTLVISTTRPELLPACVGVFVHPGDDRYKELVGQKVKTPLGDEVKVMADRQVDQEKGSGAVMCCTYGDVTDIYWTKKYKLDEKIILNKKGKLQNVKQKGYKDLNGKTVKKARDILVNKLKEQNDILDQEKINHKVGVHERCHESVEILPTKQWFVKILDKKDKWLELGEKINWYPKYMKERYKEWIKQLEWDWCISRERPYGIPIPVFYCQECDKTILLEKDQLPVDPQSDDLDLECPKCGSSDIKPETAVLDTWFTSALTPEINNDHKRNGGLKGDMVTMSMRPLAHDIIRTWVVYTIIMNWYKQKAIPWEDLMVSGHLLIEKGKKISKKDDNAEMSPKSIHEKYSIDAIRYSVCRGSLGTDTYFEPAELENGKKLVIKLFNAGKFTLGNLKNFNPEKGIEFDNLEPIDKWILYKAKKVSQKIKQTLDKYEVGKACQMFENFFRKDFCDNYLEICKGRIYGDDELGKRSAQTALYKSFLAALKMGAPFLPHITEEMFHQKDNYLAEKEDKKSIHKTLWPKIDIKKSIESTINGAKLFLSLISEVRKFKNEKEISLGKEMNKLFVVANKDQKELLKEFKNDLLSVARVNKLSFVDKLPDKIQDKDIAVSLKD